MKEKRWLLPPLLLLQCNNLPVLSRQGYKELSQRFGSLRRVRGDNYCALRATLFQVLCHSTQPPSWLQDDAFATVKSCSTLGNATSVQTDSNFAFIGQVFNNWFGLRILLWHNVTTWPLNTEPVNMFIISNSSMSTPCVHSSNAFVEKPQCK